MQRLSRFMQETHLAPILMPTSCLDVVKWVVSRALAPPPVPAIDSRQPQSPLRHELPCGSLTPSHVFESTLDPNEILQFCLLPLL